ncbi:MAG: AMP-binding protein [Firmicutes bacterium]|nr:AMP-binding protein [Bacillota bacterium]
MHRICWTFADDSCIRAPRRTLHFLHPEVAACHIFFSEWLRSLAAQYGDKPAVTCGVTMTFRELWEASGRCAVTLAEAGVRKGDKVVLWAYNGSGLGRILLRYRHGGRHCHADELRPEG